MKRFNARGFTLVEIMIVVAIIALLAAIAIPNVLRGRTTANESAAIGNVRALLSSLEMYRSVNNVYPDTWNTQMYGTDCAAATIPTPDFGPPSFCLNLDVSGTVQGYAYVYANGAVPVNTYTLLGTPQTLGTTGTRSFFASETGLISHCTGTGTVVNFTDGNEATIEGAPSACD